MNDTPPAPPAYVDEYQAAEALLQSEMLSAPPQASLSDGALPPPAPPPGGSVDISLEALQHQQELAAQAAAAPAPPVEPQPLDPALQSAHPPADPAPAAQPPAPPAAPEEPEPPEPVVRAKEPLPDGMPRNYRVAAKDPVEALALQLRVRNPDMDLGAAWSRAQQELGITPAAAPAATPSPAPAAPEPSPLQTLDARLQEIRAEQKNLDPIVDAAALQALNSEAIDLAIQRADLAAEAKAAELLAQRERDFTEASEVDAIIAAQRAEAERVFPALADPASELSQTYARLDEQMRASNDPLLSVEDYEMRLAQMAAGTLAAQGKNPHPAAAATTPGTATPSGPPSQVPASRPASMAPAPAGVVPVPGAMQSREHSIQVQAASPQQQAEQAFAQAAAGDDFAAAEAALGMALTGGRAAPSSAPGFSISVGGIPLPHG